MRIIALIAVAAAWVAAVTVPEPECPPEGETRPAVYERAWPEASDALTCEHRLMTGQVLGKECA